jgi:hypothetical protein
MDVGTPRKERVKMKNTAKNKTKSVETLQDEILEMCAQVYEKYTGAHMTNPRKEIDRVRDFEDMDDVFGLIGSGAKVAYANTRNLSNADADALLDDDANENIWRELVELFHATMTALLADERITLAGATIELIARPIAPSAKN